MRIVVQRVSQAQVCVGGAIVGRIGIGLLLLVGVENDDRQEDVEAAARKIAGLRVFADDEGLMNRSVLDVDGAILVVSQFTLLGDVRKGRRPSFTDAGSPEHADHLINQLVVSLRSKGIATESGQFGAMMQVELVNDGPVTLVVNLKDGRVQ